MRIKSKETFFGLSICSFLLGAALLQNSELRHNMFQFALNNAFIGPSTSMRKRSNESAVCVYSKLRSGGYEVQILDMLRAWGFALNHNVTYYGVIIPSEKKHKRPTIIKLLTLLNLPFQVEISQDILNSSVLVSPKSLCKNFRLISNYKSDQWIQNNPAFVKTADKRKDHGNKRKIVVQVCREDNRTIGDQIGDYYGYIPNSYYLYLIKQISKPNDQVIVYFNRIGSSQDFISSGYEVHTDISLVGVWKAILRSDVFIMSRSLSSYVPALFVKGTVYYNEFWHKPLRHWHINKSIFPATNRTRTIARKEVVIPCVGGEFGAEEIQTHACVISKATTNFYFHHIPHTAQTLFACWSWFAEKRTKNCAFLVTDGIESEWLSSFIGPRMGCLIITRQPRNCAVIGTIQKPILFITENDTWMSSYGDSEILKNMVILGRVKNKGIGILDRRKNRRIKDIAKMNITQDVIYFEDISYYDQALWFHEHDIIIAAHGAALTYSIFIQKCTVIIQLYPEHYYLYTFFESLITESGGINVSWIKNKYLGNDMALKAENDEKLAEDFENHFEKRKYWRSQDIEIDKVTLDALIEIGKKKQKICRSTLK